MITILLIESNVYRIVDSLSCTPNTNLIWYINNISIKKIHKITYGLDIF